MRMYKHFEFDGITSTKGTYQLADANSLSHFTAIGERVAGQRRHRTTSGYHKFACVFSTTSFPVFHLCRVAVVYSSSRSLSSPISHSSRQSGSVSSGCHRCCLKCLPEVVTRGLMLKVSSSRPLLSLAKLYTRHTPINYTISRLKAMFQQL
jgi:hypothetical protein